MSGAATVIVAPFWPFWPAWTRTLDAMVRSQARARSRCRRCHVLLHVDPATLRATLGGSASLIDRSGPCLVIGCTGTIYYLGAAGTGAAYHVLAADPTQREGVIDPMNLPFHSRWHDMTTIGATSSSAPAEVIAWPGAAARQGELP